MEKGRTQTKKRKTCLLKLQINRKPVFLVTLYLLRASHLKPGGVQTALDQQASQALGKLLTKRTGSEANNCLQAITSETTMSAVG